VMRCLTLAEALQKSGAKVQFVCREHDGNLCDLIERKGFSVRLLAIQTGRVDKEDHPLAHTEWLGAGWRQDAEQTLDFIRLLGAKPEWLIVDHYAIDQRWHKKLRSYVKNIFVIDDLADRPLDCDMLLDQNLGRESGDYSGLVPDAATIYTGPRYALLRAEFAALREYSLRRRVAPRLNHLLISMGGVDLDNTTGRVLETLKECVLPEDCKITVVMGPHAPWLEQVRVLSGQMPWQTEVLQNVDNMSQLMVDSDLAIGAAGSTSWERCCLGLPAIIFVLADNQKDIAMSLLEQAAVKSVNSSQIESLLSVIFSQLIEDATLLGRMSKNAADITDGKGAQKIALSMLAKVHA